MENNGEVADLLVLNRRSARITITMLCGFIVVLLWSLNKGFDLQDEAFCLLQAQNPQDYPWLSSFGYLTAKLPLLLPNQIQSLRLWHLLVTAIGAAFLSLGFYFWSVHFWLNQRPNRYFLTCCISIAVAGNLLGFTTVELALGYNGLSAALLCSAVGLTLWSCVPSTRNNIFLPVLIGLCCAFALFTKLTAALLVTTMCLLLLIRANVNLKLLISLALGFALGICIYSISFQNLNEWMQTLLSLISRTNNSGTHNLTTLTRSTFMSKSFLGPVFGFAGVVIFGMVLRKAKWSMRVKKLILLTLGGCALTAVAIYNCLIHNVHSSVVYLPLFFIAATTFTFTDFLSICVDEKMLSSRLLGLFAVTALPTLISAGTNCPIFWHQISHLGPLLLVGYLLSNYGNRDAIALSKAFIPLTALCLTLQLVFNFVLHPHGISSLCEQTRTTSNFQSLHGQLLDDSLANMLDEVYSKLKSTGYKAGDTLLCIDDGPGLVYAVSARSPVQSYWCHVTGDDYNAALLRDSDCAAPNYVVVCNQFGTSKLSTDYQRSMSALHIKFPEDYELIDTLFIPFNFWKDKQPAFLFRKFR